jgi:hypothetical protein
MGPSAPSQGTHAASPACTRFSPESPPAYSSDWLTSRELPLCSLSFLFLILKQTSNNNNKKSPTVSETFQISEKKRERERDHGPEVPTPQAPPLQTSDLAPCLSQLKNPQHTALLPKSSLSPESHSFPLMSFFSPGPTGHLVVTSP